MSKFLTYVPDSWQSKRGIFTCLQLGFQSKAEREPAKQQFFDKELPRPLALAKYQEINRSLNSSSQAKHHREGSINYEDAQFFIKKPPFLKADEEKKVSLKKITVSTASLPWTCSE